MENEEKELQNKKLVIMVVGLILATFFTCAISSQLHEIITLLRMLND